MGRAPCCEKMGLKKGPWTSEEDEILINYINQNGNGNWRALPKRAGLLRCGKSCRLRWMNYLRPDIKRGNFTAEEEDMIIQLHRDLGNKWSVIAARLPGRTDNEIKNIWHTHLKKKKKALNGKSKPEPEPETKKQSSDSSELIDKWSEYSCSPMQSSSEISSITAAAAAVTDSFGDLTEMGESFWSEIFSDGDSELKLGNSFGSELNVDDFWGDLFNTADDFMTQPFHFSSFNQHISFTDHI